ncbi:MAG: hypothetical protein R3C03_05850 [Pirellulaceae bacterium]
MMTMDEFKIFSSNSDSLPPANRNLLDLSSGAVRIRLFMLVFGLMLVLVCMNEARKPENWRWMGFDANGNISTEKQNQEEKPKSTPPATVLPNASQPDSDDSVDRLDDALPAEGQGEGQQEKSGNNSLRMSQDFWNSVFLELDSDQQKQLFLLMRAQSKGAEYSPDEKVSMLSLLDTLDGFITKHAIEFSKRIAQTDSSAEATQRILEISSEWKDGLLPYLRSTVNKDLEMLEFNPAKIGIWKAQFEKTVLGVVEDHTRMLNPSDGPAWLALWDQILEGSAGSYRTVTNYELMTQPKAYRGQPVEFEGNLLIIERVNMVRNDLGIDRYYALWIRTDELQASPMCVYTLRLPPGSEEPVDQYTPVDWMVKVQGYFFKVRDYVKRDGQIGECPLILSPVASVLPLPPKPENEFAWPVPVWFLPVILALMAGGAIMMARSVFIASRMKTYRPSKVEVSNVKRSLKDFENDTRIRSPREDIAELENREQT